MSSADPALIDSEAAALLLSLAFRSVDDSDVSQSQSATVTSSSHRSIIEQPPAGPQRVSLSTLAPKQLIQLIMRCLRTQEILLLARCCRALMAAADDPFPWSLDSLMRLHKLDADTAPLPPSFRHARVSFYWSKSTADFSLDVVTPSAAQLQLVLRTLTALGPNFFGFSASSFDLMRSQWHEMLTHPSFQTVRELQLSFKRNPPTEETFALLSKLQSLTDLRLCDHTQPASGQSAWARLCEIPHLRSLFFIDAPCGKLASRLSFAGRCPQLRKLECAEPRVYGAGAFSAALSVFARVEHLHLRSLFMQGSSNGQKPLLSNGVRIPASAMPPQREEMDRTFAAMESLATLVLESCEVVDGLLPSLVHAPSLRRLIIQPSAYGSVAFDSPVVCCSAGVAAALLESCPRLSISILLRDARLMQYWHWVFSNARVLTGARLAGRFETVDKVFRFDTAGFGVAAAPVAGPFAFASNSANTSSASSDPSLSFQWAAPSTATASASASSSSSSARSLSGNGASPNLFAPAASGLAPSSSQAGETGDSAPALSFAERAAEAAPPDLSAAASLSPAAPSASAAGAAGVAPRAPVDNLSGVAADL